MQKVRIILVEDDDSDADLVMAAAKRGGLDVDWIRADDEPSFIAALKNVPAAIITDFSLPSFSAMRVLAIVRERGADIPVLVVTGAIDDELAAECVRQGAADYLLKDRLARLRDALEGALERFRVERQKHDAERRLLSAAASRAVLNDMLLNSLSVDLSESSLRAVLKPLFIYNSPQQLEEVRLEVPDLASFSVRKPGLILPFAEAFACDSGNQAPRPERAYDVDPGDGERGRMIFVFAPGALPDRETDQFLGEVAYIVAGVVRRARAERGLRQSLAEQDELLREVHHRVKNNLAAVQGLVSLEAARLDEGPGKSALADIEGQVRSMALVHEMLYSRGGFTGIGLEDYLRELKIRVADSLRCPHESLLLAVDCDGLCVPLEAAVTLGLLLNELFAHSAARVLASGPVEIRVLARPTPEGDRLWTLEYEETGSPGEYVGSGLGFVEMFLPQYRGSIEVSADRISVAMRVLGDKIPQVSP
jgi:Signal transduction histidine kinase